jgi:hypothetical protein
LINALSSVAPPGKLPAGIGDTLGPLTQLKVTPEEVGFIVIVPEFGAAQVTFVDVFV